MSQIPSDAPESHYDRVTQAWRYLMGESFHYGYFDPPGQQLDDATFGLTRRLVSLGRIRGEHRVLDVGCGIGGPARYLAREVGCRVTGISTSASGVAEARRLSAADGDRVAFEVRDGMRNGFADASFDRVWVMESSHLMPDKRAMLGEAARVLVRDGRLVLCDIIVQRDLPIDEVVRRAREFDLLRRVFGRAKMETLSTYGDWLEEAGFSGIETEDVSVRARPTFRCWRENADRNRSEVISLIGESAWQEFRDACDVLETMWNDEILGYGWVSAEKVA